jgi:hypothetical protein
VKLKKPVPLYFAYITAWATEDGLIQFRRDIYQKDGIGEKAGAYCSRSAEPPDIGQSLVSTPVRQCAVAWCFARLV